MSIRNSAKAIIIENGNLLVTENKDSQGIFYLLPGGGQEKFESLHDALKRECMEEIGTEVIINDILFIRDYIGKNHEHKAINSEAHQVEFMFACERKDHTVEVKNGYHVDSMQIGVAWFPIKDLPECRLYPKEMEATEKVRFLTFLVVSKQ